MDTTKSTMAMPTAAGGAAGAVVTIVCYVLSAKFNITVPGEVAGAAMVIITPVIHWIGLWMQKESPKLPVSQ